MYGFSGIEGYQSYMSVNFSELILQEILIKLIYTIYSSYLLIIVAL